MTHLNCDIFSVTNSLPKILQWLPTGIRMIFNYFSKDQKSLCDLASLLLQQSHLLQLLPSPTRLQSTLIFSLKEALSIPSQGLGSCRSLWPTILLHIIFVIGYSLSEFSDIIAKSTAQPTKSLFFALLLTLWHLFMYLFTCLTRFQLVFPYRNVSSTKAKYFVLITAVLVLSAKNSIGHVVGAPKYMFNEFTAISQCSIKLHNF